MNNKHLSQFNTLSEDEQAIVLALSVILMPMGQNVLVQLLKRSGCVDAKVADKITPILKAKLNKTE